MTIVEKLIEDRTFNSAEKLYLLALVTQDSPEAQKEWLRRKLAGAKATGSKDNLARALRGSV